MAPVAEQEAEPELKIDHFPSYIKSLMRGIELEIVPPRGNLEDWLKAAKANLTEQEKQFGILPDSTLDIAEDRLRDV